jgi:hypothetical protein
VGYSVGGVHSTPAGLTCGFGSLSTSTTTATLGSSGFATTTLVVGAASGYSIASNTVPAQPASRWWIAGGGTTLACIFLLGLPTRRRKWQTMLGACAMLIVSFGMSGCGVNVASGPNKQYYSGLNGGSSGTPLTPNLPVPAGTYTVLVTATTTTNTTLTHTLPIQVQVGIPAVIMTPQTATITKGQKVNLIVVADNATSVAITGSGATGADTNTYNLPLFGGTQVVAPSVTTTYTATVTGQSGKVTAVSTITVQ